MLTPASLHAMSPDERVQLFEALAVRHYGQTRWHLRVGQDFGVHEKSVFRWIKEENVPPAVLYALDAWVAGGATDPKLLDDWAEVAAQLSAVAVTLARLAQRLPGVPGDAAASSAARQAAADCP